MKIRLKSKHWLKFLVILASLTTQAFCTIDFQHFSPQAFQSFSGVSSLVLVPFILVSQLNEFVECTQQVSKEAITVTMIKSRGIASKKSQEEDDDDVSKQKISPITSSSRKPRLIKELTMLNRQSCLAKILCGVEVAKPPTDKTSTMNDYAYLVKSFFDRLSIQGAANNDEDNDESQEDDLDSLLGHDDLNRYKNHLRKNSKRPSYTSPDDQDSIGYFGDMELDQLDGMPLEELLKKEGSPHNSMRRRSKSSAEVKSLQDGFTLPIVSETNSSSTNNRSKSASGRNESFQTVQRGYMGFYNPRFDKTAFLNKKQLLLEQASNEEQKLQIASDIAKKLRSPRQCRLLGWFRPSYTTTTTITTTSNNPNMINSPTPATSSMCPFTVNELQKMILGSQVQSPNSLGVVGQQQVQSLLPTTSLGVSPLSSSVVASFPQVGAPLGTQPIQVQVQPTLPPAPLAYTVKVPEYAPTTAVPPPATPPAPATPPPRPTPPPSPFSDFDDEERPSPAENKFKLPKLPGVSTYYRPEDDEQMDVFGNPHGDLVRWKFQHRPTHPPSPYSKPTPSLFQFKTPSPSKIPGPPPGYVPFDQRPKPPRRPDPFVPSNGMFKLRPTPNPKLQWTTTSTRSPWVESVFNYNVPAYSYSKPNKNYAVKGRPGKLPVDYRLRDGLDSDANSEEDSTEGDSEEGNEEDNHLSQNIDLRKPPPPHSRTSSNQMEDRSEESEESEPKGRNAMLSNDRNSEDSKESQEELESPSDPNESLEETGKKDKTQDDKNSEDSKESQEEVESSPYEKRDYKSTHVDLDESVEESGKKDIMGRKGNRNRSDTGSQEDNESLEDDDNKKLKANTRESNPDEKTNGVDEENDENSAEDSQRNIHNRGKSSLPPVNPHEEDDDDDDDESLEDLTSISAKIDRNRKPVHLPSEEYPQPEDPNDDEDPQPNNHNDNHPSNSPNNDNRNHYKPVNNNEDHPSDDTNDDDDDDDDDEDESQIENLKSEDQEKDDDESPEEIDTEDNHQKDNEEDDTQNSKETSNNSPELQDPTDVNDESEETVITHNQPSTSKKVIPTNRNKRGQQKYPQSQESSASSSKSQSDSDKKDSKEASSSSGGILKSILSDHGIRTLSRITSLFSYGSKEAPSSPSPPPPPPPPPPRRRRKKRPNGRPPPHRRPQHDHRPQDDQDDNDDDDSDEQDEEPKPKKKKPTPPPQLLHPVQLPPKVIPIYIEGKESWEGEEKPHEEEHFERVKKRKPTSKPDKYDYDEEDSNESNASTNTQEALDFGPGQKINTEYSDITGSFLRPGDRYVDSDRYVSGLPTTWENIYEEMKKNKAKEAAEKKKQKENKKNSNLEEDEAVQNDDEGSDESEEDERPSAIHEKGPPHKSHGQHPHHQFMLEPID